ncbi:MAG: hypothetical protein H6719_15520 [Sandaracinaceae bacterium]|nr:hypothetical protein [Sandaracinaceae bacterium]
MIRLVALLALALVTSDMEAPSTALASTGASHAEDVEVESHPSTPAPTLRVAATSAPRPVRTPAPVTSPAHLTTPAPEPVLPARPRWRRIARLRSDAAGDD